MSFSARQRAVSSADFSREIRKFALEPRQAVLGGLVGLFFQRFLLDLELHDAPVEFVQLFRLGIDLHPQPRGGFVDEVDRLVRQEAVRNVPVRQGRSRDKRGIADADAMVQFVFFLQAAKNRDGVLDGRLADEDRLEAAGESRVLFDMLAVFVERGRADAMQFAARQRGLEQVGGVHRAIRLAGPDQRVHLVDEQDDPARGRRDFVEDGFQPFLELAAIFGAGDQRAHVERKQALVAQAFRDVAIDDPQREAFDDRRLADAGLADQDRIVLGAARKHLNGAADFLIAADHRVELAFARRLREVAGVFLQRVIGVFGGGGIRGAAFAKIFDGAVQALRSDAGLGEDLARVAVGVHRKRKQQPFHGHEGIAGFLGDFFGGVEDAGGRRSKIELARAAAFHARQFGERQFALLQGVARPPPGPVDQSSGQSLLVVEQHLEKMKRRELLMAFAQSQRLRRLNEAPRALGQLFDIHVKPPMPAFVSQ